MPRVRSKQQKSSEAARLRRLRSTLGLTQRELAVEFKVAHGAIASWESGKQTLPGPVIKLLELYEEELGIGLDDHGIVRLKTSMLARNAALSRSTAAAVTQAIGGWLERMLAGDERRNAITTRTHAAIARGVVESLGDLKGLAMKVGQMLGYIDYALPPGAREEFSSLQLSSRAMSPAAIAQVFLEEFGEPPRKLFAEWSPTPFAAASIGQVHRARLVSGELVAVKVQYPNIVEAIEADLRSAAIFDRLSSLLFRGQERGAFVAEIRERFTEECDYRLEAANQEEFRRLWAGRPGIRIPKVFHDLSRRRVLVTSLEPGENLKSFLTHATQEQRDRTGLTLWQFCFESMFRHGVFHCDPHAGNFLLDDGGLVVLDFGCVKRFPQDDLRTWRDAMRATLERDTAALRKRLVDARTVPATAHYDFDYDVWMIYNFYEPWLRDAPFRFTREFAQRAWQTSVVDSPNKFRINTPRNWFMANRTQFGLYSLLGSLEATANYRECILDLLYSPGEERPAPFTEAEIALLRR
jgi:predicted unusual protein kinase regulating ubiquinone biosynthesis (AarF/ABC1/UbiB family)/DNA-binding XRE family transcriptional regulator